MSNYLFFFAVTRISVSTCISEQFSQLVFLLDYIKSSLPQSCHFLFRDARIVIGGSEIVDQFNPLFCVFVLITNPIWELRLVGSGSCKSYVLCKVDFVVVLIVCWILKFEFTLVVKRADYVATPETNGSVIQRHGTVKRLFTTGELTSLLLYPLLGEAGPMQNLWIVLQTCPTRKE